MKLIHISLLIYFNCENILIAFCNDNIYLIETNNKKHKCLNNVFIENNGLYNLTTLYLGSSDFESFIYISKRYPNLINLLLPDFYCNNYNEILNSNLVYAGDLINKYVYETDYYENKCLNNEVKIISKGVIENFPTLFYFVTEFDGVRKNVAICYKHKINIHNNYKFDINPCEIDKNTIAVIALDKTLIEDLDYTKLPILFYDNILPEVKDQFPNSIKMLDMNKMVHVFLYFLNQMGWKRVAILSDSEPYSEIFEKQLSDLFSEHGISHVIERCMGFYCDFDEPLKILSQSKPKIIIANIGEEYASNIITYMDKYNMTIYKNVVWIVRDWSSNHKKEFISISMTPKISFSDDMRRNWIFKSLSVLNELKRPYMTDFSYNRHFTAKIKKQFDRETARAVILKGNKEIDIIAIGKDGNVESLVGFKNPYPYVQDIDNCILRSKNYYKPCSDNDLIFLLLILMVFSFTILGITSFFINPTNKYLKLED